MIQPFLQDDAFVADLESARQSGHGPHIWWLGQSGYLVHLAGRSVLFDPYLSDSLTRKYAATDKPHVRMTELVVAPDRLTGISLVTSSHLHTDHLDGETLMPLVAANPEIRLICPESQRALSRTRSGLADSRIVGLDVPSSDVGQIGSVSAGDWDGIQFEAVPAAHESLDRDSKGHLLYLGFIVRWGGWTFYHSGDTVLYPGMEARLKGQGIDIAFLPINGRAPERKVSGNLSGREAAQLAKAIGARYVVPGHYELFEFNTATPDEFEAECRALGQGYRIFRAGERWSPPEQGMDPA
jgi:L-ascorbate metabolism protein UlaG (beta-lactamase superfamily)